MGKYQEITAADFKKITPQAKVAVLNMLTNKRGPHPSLTHKDVQSIPKILCFRPDSYTFPLLGDLRKNFVKIGLRSWWELDPKDVLFKISNRNPKDIGVKPAPKSQK